MFVLLQMLGRLIKKKKNNSYILSQSPETHSPCHPPFLVSNAISVRFISLEHIHRNSISLVRMYAVYPFPLVTLAL